MSRSMIYYIRMGQGIIGQGPHLVPNENEEGAWIQEGPNFLVRTSFLQTCTLICAYNSATRRGGAFHYPAFLKSKADLSESEKEALAGMEAWIVSLKPDQVTLINSWGANYSDTKTLTKWVKQERLGFLPPGEVKYKQNPSGGMEIKVSSGQVEPLFAAGNPNGELEFPEQTNYDMAKVAAGFNYTLRTPAIDLFGNNLEDEAEHPVDQGSWNRRPYINEGDDSGAESSDSETSDSDSEEDSKEEEDSREGEDSKESEGSREGEDSK